MFNIVAAGVIGLAVLAFWLLIAAFLALAVCNLWLDLKDRITERRRGR
jgi:membrane protein implicated in regulation of membrane protease activity